MLATIGAHAGQHELAVTYLEDQLPRTPPNKLCNIHKRLAYSHFKLGDYDKAEYHTRHVLKESPADVTAKGWLDTTLLAKQTGDYSALDTLFFSEDILLGVTGTLSEFVTFHLDRCDYFGLEASKIAAHSYTEKDADAVADRVRNEGFHRARPRANLFLTAARILIDCQSEDEDKIRRHLSNYCAAMGYASLAERKPIDVAASYYTELFLTAPRWDREVEISLSRYIMLLRSAPIERLRQRPRRVSMSAYGPPCACPTFGSRSWRICSTFPP